MKGLLLGIMALFFGLSIAEAGCGSKTTNCYDYCENGYVPVAGDSCGTEYDYGRNCYKAVGTCSSGGGAGCKGETQTCYDYCTAAYVTLEDADSCTTSYNYVKGCYQAVGTCSK